MERSPDNGPHSHLVDWIKSPNIADEFDNDRLQTIGRQVTREFDIDDQSRSDYVEKNRAAFKLAMQVAEEKTSPWPKASNVIFPLMTTAAIHFAGRLTPAIVPGRSVVKGIVIGDDNGEPRVGPDGTPAMQMQPDGQPQPVWAVQPGTKRKRADKIAAHMSWQFLSQIEEWEDDKDKLAHMLPIAGCCFTKSYFDRALGQNVCDLATAENVVIHYWAKSLARAARISECVWFYPTEIEELQRSEVWLKEDFGKAMPSGSDDKPVISSEDDDAPHEFIEQHRRLDLDDDGYAEPYVVTVHKSTGKVARIVARYDADGVKIRGQTIMRIEPVQYYTKYDFFPNPEGGIYGVGFGQLLQPLNHSVNTLINQLIDAGTLSNTATGFIGRGLSMNTGAVRFKMGQFMPVNAPGGRIRDAIVPLQFPQPSQVLFSLLGLMVEAAKEVGSIKDILSGQAVSANMSPTTFMGLIDQGLQVFVGIYKRIHRSMKAEYRKHYRLNRIYLEDHSRYQEGDQWRAIGRDDYAKGAGVEPISDPSMVSNQIKLARAEFLGSFKNDPLIDQVEIRRRQLDAADIPDADKLIVKQQPPNPMLMIEAANIEREGAKARSIEVLNYAKAIQALSAAANEASKTDREHDIAWAEHQMEILKFRMEAVNGSMAGGQQPGAAGPGGAASPGAGTRAGSQIGIPGARQAPDGHHYVDDPARPGKFMRVVPHGDGV
jgi:chaperonin GroES